MAFRTTDVTEQMDTYDKFITAAKLNKEPHQRVGVSWMVKKELSPSPSYGVRGGIISDEMGLGKTIQMIGLIKANPVKNTFILAPPALLDQWKNEIERTTDIKPLVFHGQHSRKITEEDIKASPITLTTYDMAGINLDKKATAKSNTRSSLASFTRLNVTGSSVTKHTRSATSALRDSTVFASSPKCRPLLRFG